MLKSVLGRNEPIHYILDAPWEVTLESVFVAFVLTNSVSSTTTAISESRVLREGARGKRGGDGRRGGGEEKGRDEGG